MKDTVEVEKQNHFSLLEWCCHASRNECSKKFGRFVGSSLECRFDPKYPQTCEKLRRTFSPFERIRIGATHFAAQLTIIKGDRAELETRCPLGPDLWTLFIEAIQKAKMMTPALHAELIRRYPKFFREPGKRLVEPDPEDPSSSENHLEDDMGPYDEWGIECGDGWFALIDRLCQACEREIEGLIALGISNERWPRVAQIKEKMGSLRFRITGPVSDSLQEQKTRAELESLSVCEQCAAPGMLRDGRWRHTYCDRCHAEEEARRRH